MRAYNNVVKLLAEIRITPDTVKLDNVPYSEPVDASKLFGPVKKCSDPPVK